LTAVGKTRVVSVPLTAGETDGLVTVALGDSDGDSDGEWLGDSDGEWLGDSDGDWLGDSDGDWLGEYDGEPVACPAAAPPAVMTTRPPDSATAPTSGVRGVRTPTPLGLGGGALVTRFS
jgi:hypothetical protein